MLSDMLVFLTLPVGVSFKGNWLQVYGATSSISSFVLVCDNVQFLQPFRLVVNYCKFMLFGVHPRSTFHHRLFDLVVRSEWLLGVFKVLVAEGVLVITAKCKLFEGDEGDQLSPSPPVWLP